MYKLILCWRYLRTRFLAFICIISVMLGVATLIVVNSVMSGFSTKLKLRLHGILSDVVVESRGFDGGPILPKDMIGMIRESPAGPHVAAMSPTVEVPAMMRYYINGTPVTQGVKLIGIDPKLRAEVGGFAEHLVDPKRRDQPSFELSRYAAERFRALHPLAPPNPMPPVGPAGVPPPDPTPAPSRNQFPSGAIVGFALATIRLPDPETGLTKDHFLMQPGDELLISTVGTQDRAPVVFDTFIVCDYFKSEMSEYDATYVYVPLDQLQNMRTMEGRVTSMQIRLTDFRHAESVVESLKKLFPTPYYQVETWQDKQGPLLAAIAIERGLLNVLLFLIIGVAGFGILAIFSMIVSEKTRDIGILKSLGASSRGVMSIFLGYGLMLGVIGSLFGTGLGLLITRYINEIESFLTKITGSEIFPRKVYYFESIPTDIQPVNIMLICFGAVAIATTFSILPALRAAMLNPVRALRFE
jgi:lipoprotein-releasing system permease protein